MQLLQALFVKDFKCIGSACDNSCCIDWGIIFDSEYLKKCEELGVTDIIVNTAPKDNGDRVVVLNEDGRCPYLNDSNLCRLIIDHGEDALSKTCTIFPRGYERKNDIYEYSLSNACPEVINILNITPRPIEFNLFDMDNIYGMDKNANEDLIQCRNMIIDLLQIQDIPLWSRLFFIIGFINKLRVACYENIQSVVDKYNTADYLLALYSGLKNKEYDFEIKFTSLMNLLEAVIGFDMKSIYRQRCIDLYEYATSINPSDFKEEWIEYQTIMTKYEGLLENVAVNSVFRNINCENVNDFHYSVLVFIEEMAIIIFVMFLDWLKNDKIDNYIEVRTIICVFARWIEHANKEDMYKYVSKLDGNGWFTSANVFVLLR